MLTGPCLNVGLSRQPVTAPLQKDDILISCIYNTDHVALYNLAELGVVVVAQNAMVVLLSDVWDEAAVVVARCWQHNKEKCVYIS